MHVLGAPPAFVLSQDRTLRPKRTLKFEKNNGFKEFMKDGGFRKASRPISSHLCKPVLNGLSDLLRLPQYPVLGVRAAASAGVRREGELYTRLRAGGKRGRGAPRDAHKSGDNEYLGAFPVPGDAGARQHVPAATSAGPRIRARFHRRRTGSFQDQLARARSGTAGAHRTGPPEPKSCGSSFFSLCQDVPDPR